MPRLNNGTVLENIVVLEATRVCFDHSREDTDTVFASAFAMPPLTQCWYKDSETRRANDLLAVVRQNPPPPPETLSQLWAYCIQNQPHLPVCGVQGGMSNPKDCGGPSGALLAGMLAAQRNRLLHFWINDYGGRYGATPPNVPSSQSEIPQLLALAGALIGAPANGTVVGNFGAFPGTIAALQTWLAQGNVRTARTRIGFLDPDNYVNGGTPVSRADHEEWLRALADGCEKVLSVMFFACRDHGVGNTARNERLAWFHADGLNEYPQSIVFEKGNFLTGVKVRWPAESIQQITQELRTTVEAAWNQCHPALLTAVHFNGIPGHRRT